MHAFAFHTASVFLQEFDWLGSCIGFKVQDIEKRYVDHNPTTPTLQGVWYYYLIIVIQSLWWYSPVAIYSCIQITS